MPAGQYIMAQPATTVREDMPSYSTDTTATTTSTSTGGWYGRSNGYFLINHLSPDELGEGGGYGSYNVSQEAITGIRPSLGGSDRETAVYGRRTPVIHTIQRHVHPDDIHGEPRCE